MHIKKTVLIFIDKKGREPFSEWLNALKDRTVRARINYRLSKLQLGNLGDWESVGEGVFELRFFFGSGFRVYFAKEGSSIILLLCGGDKKTQSTDIIKAKEYWREFQEIKSEKS